LAEADFGVWDASFGLVGNGLTDGEFVGFLTIEYRERETWAAELVRNSKGFFRKETLAVTF